MDEQRAANVYSLKTWVASMRTAALIDRPSRARPAVLVEEGRLISAEGMFDLAIQKLQAGMHTYSSADYLQRFDTWSWLL